MLRIFFLQFFIFLFLGSTAQIISGTVKDTESGKAIEAATLFIPRTTAGTLTKPDGSYEFKIPAGASELVISHLGYRTRNIKIAIEPGNIQTRNFELYPEAKDLRAITISAKQGKKWRKQLKQFQKKFLGNSKNAGQCSILNPTVLQFEEQDGKLKASASDILEIKNRALGYTLFFLLEHFEAQGPNISYAGKPFFRALAPADDKQAKTWHRERRLAYEGSLNHFLNALVKNRLRQEGFDLQTAVLKNNEKFVVTGSIRPKQLLAKSHRPSEKLLSFNGFLKITYSREEDGSKRADPGLGRAASSLGHPAEQDMIAQDNSMKRHKGGDQVSYLFARKNCIPIDTAGFSLRPELLVTYGYWNTEGAADLVPLDFNHHSPVVATAESFANAAPIPETVDSFPPLNGFSFSRLRIPYSEIRSGGPPRDGIPAIDHPEFVSVEIASGFLSGEDELLGITINGITKAYPIKILNYHEVVNDTFEEEAIVITYCPLCGSGVAFRRQLVSEPGKPSEQKIVDFGVSGLLFNSDVLLYDRQTESLWSQIMGEAISGPLSGTKLEILPLQHTTFDDWKKQYPNTLILSPETGHQRNYDRSPYAGYEQSDRIMFEVAERSDLLPNKARVIGIEVNGIYKAYPLISLKKAEKTIEDTVNGKRIFIEYDRESDAAIINNESGEILPTITLYWFAWYAFHPDTKVYKD